MGNGFARTEIARLRTRVTELEREKEAVERFAAMAAHELLTPVVLMDACAATVRDRLDGDGHAESREELDVLRRGAAQSRLLVETLLHHAAFGDRPLRAAAGRAATRSSATASLCSRRRSAARRHRRDRAAAAARGRGAADRLGVHEPAHERAQVRARGTAATIAVGAVRDGARVAARRRERGRADPGRGPRAHLPALPRAATASAARAAAASGSPSAARSSSATAASSASCRWRAAIASRSRSRPSRASRVRGIAARLYWFPLSHPAHAVRRMLELKGIEYELATVLPGTQRMHLRLVGFRGGTVPALKLDGRRVQGSRAIARALEAARPDPPLFPTDRAVETWADEELQMVPRRILRWGLTRDAELRRWISEASGVPAPGAVGALGLPAAKYYARAVGADEAAVRRALDELPGDARARRRAARRRRAHARGAGRRDAPGAVQRARARRLRRPARPGRRAPVRRARARALPRLPGDPGLPAVQLIAPAATSASTSVPSATR